VADAVISRILALSCATALGCAVSSDVYASRSVNGSGLGSVPNTMPNTIPGYIGIIHTGQSLSTGDFGTPVLSTTPNVTIVQLHDSSGVYNVSNPTAPTLSVIPLVAPIRADKYASGGGNTSPYPVNIGGESSEVACSLTLAAKASALVAASCVGQGGALYTVIAKGGTGNAYAASLFEATALRQLLPTYVPRVVILTHGESDAQSTTYQANLQTLAANYQADLGAGVPILISQQNNFPAIGSGGVATWEGLSTLAQLAAVVANPGTIIGICPKYQYVPNPSDDAHLINTSYQLLGEKYAEPIYQYVKTGVWSWKPLYPVSFVRSGTVVTITLNVPVGPVVVDGSHTAPHGTAATYGTNGSVFGSGHPGWTGGDGFECWSGGYGGTPIAISSVSIVGSTIALTCASNPDTVAYAMTPDRTTVGAYTGGFPDGRVGMIHDSDTWAGTLTNTAQPNWLWAFVQSGL
jgi:hypothetical protein